VKIRSEKLRQLRQNNFPVVIQNDKESFFSLFSPYFHGGQLLQLFRGFDFGHGPGAT
jgi:hypothetical protein